MQIRTQVYCFVTFLAILLTGSLVHSQVQGVKTVIAQLPVQDALAHVDRVYLYCTALKQTVCEPASGGANIRAGEAGHIDGERFEPRIQLFAAA